MIDKICEFLTKKIKVSLPDIDDERAEIINYGLQNIIGEIPKMFLMIVIAFLLGIGPLTLLCFFIILPFRAMSGGFHLKSHLGCIIGTTAFYCGIAFLSKVIVLEPIYLRYIAILATWIFGMIMVTLYAPADTENVPIISKKERRKKRIASYITLTITLGISIFIKDTVVFNIIWIGMLVQSLNITRLAYKLTNNKYGYETYQEENISTNVA